MDPRHPFSVITIMAVAAIGLSLASVGASAIPGARTVDSRDGDPDLLELRIDPRVQPIDLPSSEGTPARTIPFTLAPNGVAPEGDNPSAVSFTPDGSRIVVAHRVSRNLIVIDAVTRLLLREIPLSGSPGDLAISLDGAIPKCAKSLQTSSPVELARGSINRVLKKPPLEKW